MRFLYPKKCLVCGRIIEADVFCPECEENYGDLSGYKMGDKFLDKCVFALYHTDAIKHKIWCYKFHSKRSLARPFSELLYKAFNDYYSKENFDLIVSVPVTRKSRIKRGYNHAALMAKYLSRKINLPFSDKVLLKTRDTDQHLKTRSDRRKNLKGAFKHNKRTDVSGKRVLLLDDVLTTGITMKECARVLKRAGAKYVTGLALSSNGREPLLDYR